jgi:signal transduction histidine kinase
VVAGSGALLPAGTVRHAWLAAGILAGAMLGAAQAAAMRRRFPVPGEAFVFAQAAVWTFLAHASGGHLSLLVAGYLLELPLSGSLLGRRGIAVATVACMGAYLSYGAWVAPPLEWSSAALVVGFIALAASLTWVLVGQLERHGRLVEAAYGMLEVRTESLVAELRLLGDYLSGALLALDDMGRVVSMNRAGEALLGVEVAAALGRPWQEVLKPDPPTAGGVCRTLSEAEPQRGVPMTLHRADGHPVCVGGDLWVAPSPGGRRTYLLLDRRPPGSEAADPLHCLGEAAATVAHQFKNSIHALRGMARLIESDAAGRGGPGENARHLLGVLESLEELSEDMLGMAGASRPSVERVSLAKVLSSSALLARRDGACIRVDYPAEEIHVSAHRGRLVHALFNLMDNACRATPPGSAVRVRVAREPGSARIEIQDGGPGLPPEFLDARGPTPSREGAGLGLFAARRFLESGGARLCFEAGPGGGTLCRVWLPLAGVQPEAAQVGR